MEGIANLEHFEREGAVVAVLSGEIDASNATELRLAISERLPAAARALVADLTGVTYLDSAGVHLLFELGRRLAARRQRFHVVVPDGAPTRRLLELCDVRSVAPISATVDGAIAAIVAAEG